MNRIISNINAKLDGSRRGGSGPDEYREQIGVVRRDFNAFNEAAVDPQANFGYSGPLRSGSFRPR
ncbi:hypothetical protein KM539_14715 [Xanthomonas translucens pv. poae]|uniref:hypothetical protein n=1 Tax=Xanthomonas graminis TaxID=3390026 RepID=UPI001112D77A|nr:hypothetical protein [Xanthomonas translucens]UKE61034.1 hypothetical protein KM539_14715 [Xanthomonas translucens pv. poae]